MLDGIGEECGVVGIWAPGTDVAPAVYQGLIALQHRGQESAGIAVADGERIARSVGMGEVRHAFQPAALTRLTGHLGIGHVRYSTTGDSTVENAQPLLGRMPPGGSLALAHNGNITAVAGVGVPGDSTADTRLLVAQIGDEDGPLDAALRAVLARTSGAYSIVACDAQRLYAARDPYGFRPLCLGALPGGGWVVASESPVLDLLGATLVREVSPGEVLLIDDGGPRSTRFAAPARVAACSFEHVYFARSDTVLGGRRVQQVRRALGRALAREAPATGDVVIPVPDTARPAALGFAETSGIPYDEGLARNNYVGRTFIQPEQHVRRAAVLLKLNPIAEVVAGRAVVLVDDSIVRATSMTQVVAMLRAAGARRVHVRVASPPVRWPCFFGVDMKTGTELVANRCTPAEIGRMVGADSLEYLSVEALREAVGGAESCVGCFTGAYPVPVSPPTRLVPGRPLALTPTGRPHPKTKTPTLLTTGDRRPWQELRSDYRS
ncbi:amidophosphoribosyltransferase [Micromonospora sp. KC606]|uniref:amidophosphoribosyltransferase n=1 Tax=Micromonospora sp. KC606 TaxID=2530379 RepID=UPI0010485079|nr:amidophosphoribosyltransferase [Micromonospora sp. KC606]TDC85051.1 amidophosphoribosyltransferase [Micromonospora sp. KC606]